jgi:hypothetical protein
MKKFLLIFLVQLSFLNSQYVSAQCVTITQPDTTLICPSIGSSTTVSVSSNLTSVNYTWQYRVVTATNSNPAWMKINAANSGAVYTNYTTENLGITRVSSVLPAKGTQYRVVVSGGNCGDVTSDAANLIILDDVKAGKIVSEPSVCSGNDMTLTLTDFIGSSFQWESSSTSSGGFTPIIGETAETLTLLGVSNSINKYYRVVVSNDVCSTIATTNVKTVKVDLPSIGGIITGGGTMCSDSNTTLRLNGYKGSIQWEYSKDGVNYDKAPIAQDYSPDMGYETTSVSNIQPTYVVGNLITPTYFRAKVSNGLCSSTYSNVVTCVVGNTAETSGISPASSTICRGTGLSLNVIANGSLLTWEKSTNWNSTNPTWTVTTNHSATLNTGNLNLSTAYRVRVSVGLCSDQSTIYTDTAIVNVLPQAIAKTATANITVPSGKTISTPLCTSDTSKVLTLATGYTGDVQWQASTTSSTSGFTDLLDETGYTYTVTNPAVGVNYFRAKFTNSCGVSVYNTPIAVYYADCSSGKISNILESQPLSFNVYPNPYADSFNINLATSNENKVSMAIFDLTGREIEKHEYLVNDFSTLQFGSQYPSGVYTIMVTQGNESKVLKVVKQ